VMTTRQIKTYIVYDVLLIMNSKSVIIRTIFYFAFNMMNIMDIFVLWLLKIAYVIGTRLLDNVVMHAICYVKCVFSYRSNFVDCVNESTRPGPLTHDEGDELKRIHIKLRVFDPGRLLVVRVRNLNQLTLS